MQVYPLLLPIQKLDETLPILKPDQKVLSTDPSSGIQVTWIGHATVLVQMEGLNVLTDPVFSARASPFSFAGPKRFREAACSIEELPRIDAVMISHNHYDHLDVNSVRDLNNKHKGDEIHWLVPKGQGQWMRSTGCKNVTEFEWWEEKEVKGVTVAFVPVQHWSKRTATDDNKVILQNMSFLKILTL